MAHLAPHLKNHHHHHPQQPPTAAIFSPSVARAAASTAKDWSYVDDWLRRKYSSTAAAAAAGGKRYKPPQFERNPDTLKVLLALAAANEAADEERAQLLRIEEAALEEEKQRQKQEREKKENDNEEEESGSDQIVEGILTALEDGLSREGRAALDATAGMAVELGAATATAAPTPQRLAAAFVELQGQLSEAELAAQRVTLLQTYLEGEAARINTLLQKLRGKGQGQGQGDGDRNPADVVDADTLINADLDEGANPADTAALHHNDENDTDTDDLATLARQNLSLQRAVKAAAAQLPELQQQVAAAERASGGPPRATVDEVADGDEAAYAALRARKRALDARLAAFAGLPPDVEAARAELEARRRALRALTESRDANFEMLVERESPVKVRKGPRRI
ncbi:hypothetical protein SLS62_000574 [Diatrype stigma]|uniref:Uncharacterized protein n=1 Tax=Diatrype stigma TaxID=117547 RepID=A0AAN9VAH1_9PEZI